MQQESVRRRAEGGREVGEGPGEPLLARLQPDRVDRVPGGVDAHEEEGPDRSVRQLVEVRLGEDLPVGRARRQPAEVEVRGGH